MNTLHIIHDAPSVRRPRIVRTRWTPDARQQNALADVKTNLDKRQTYPVRNTFNTRKDPIQTHAERLRRAEYWHTSPYTPGMKMTINPPTDPASADLKEHP